MYIAYNHIRCKRYEQQTGAKRVEDTFFKESLKMKQLCVLLVMSQVSLNCQTVDRGHTNDVCRIKKRDVAFANDKLSVWVKFENCSNRDRRKDIVLDTLKSLNVVQDSVTASGLVEKISKEYDAFFYVTAIQNSTRKER
jgi:hypothetical protein